MEEQRFNKKAMIKNLTKIVSFLLILVVLLLVFSYALSPKDNTAKGGMMNPNARGFYSEKKNSIDVMILGNSDAYSGFSPMELWNEYGITSYISAEGRSTVSDSLNLLKEALSCQKPKLVILETDELFFDQNKVDEFSTNIAASLNRTFSVFRYHNRWKTTSFEELFKKPDYTAHCVSKGQYLSNKIKGYTGKEYMKKTSKKNVMPLVTRSFTAKFLNFCKSRDIPVLLVQVPSKTSWSYKKHNTMKHFAEENNVPFLDLDLKRQEYGFDWKTDTRDGGNHLNCRGAKKVSLTLGAYLLENYQLEDHRGQENFQNWDEDYKEYYKTVYSSVLNDFK